MKREVPVPLRDFLEVYRQFDWDLQVMWWDACPEWELRTGSLSLEFSLEERRGYGSCWKLIYIRQLLALHLSLGYEPYLFYPWLPPRQCSSTVLPDCSQPNVNHSSLFFVVYFRSGLLSSPKMDISESLPQWLLNIHKHVDMKIQAIRVCKCLKQTNEN